MKKMYIKPSVMVMGMKLTGMVCGSQDITSDKGIVYGGVDEDGEIVPAARGGYFIWDE